MEIGKGWGFYPVKSCYNHIMREELSRSHTLPALQIWKTWVPPRIAVFGWEACRECILTLDKLESRGQVLVNRCFLCKKAEEACKHLLLWCPVAYEFWTMIYGLMGIHWVIADFVSDEVWAWDGLTRKRNTL